MVADHKQGTLYDYDISSRYFLDAADILIAAEAETRKERACQPHEGTVVFDREALLGLVRDALMGATLSSAWSDDDGDPLGLIDHLSGGPDVDSGRHEIELLLDRVGAHLDAAGVWEQGEATPRQFDEQAKSLLKRAAGLVGNPGVNISGSADLACDQWQWDYEEWAKQQQP